MGKADYTGIAIVAGVGIIGYGLLKSGFFEGVGEIGTGIGTAVGGTGAAIGEIASDTAQVTSNIADFTNPLGAFGNAVALNFQSIGEIQQYLRQREFEQSNIVDVGAFVQTKDPLTNIQAERDIFKAEQNLLRVKDWETSKTQAQDTLTDYATSALKIPTWNPFSKITDWVSSQVKSIRTPTITADVVSTGSEGVTAVSIPTSNLSSSIPTSNLSSSSTSIIPDTPYVLPMITGTLQGLPISILPTTTTTTTEPTLISKIGSFILRRFTFL